MALMQSPGMFNASSGHLPETNRDLLFHKQLFQNRLIGQHRLAYPCPSITVFRVKKAKRTESNALQEESHVDRRAPAEQQAVQAIS